MKQVKSIKCWTDYPFTMLGDTAGAKAPHRKVTVLGYDGNKYATIVVEGDVTEIKAGYLYSSKQKAVYQYGRYWYKCINQRKLHRMTKVDMTNGETK